MTEHPVLDVCFGSARFRELPGRNIVSEQPRIGGEYGGTFCKGRNELWGIERSNIGVSDEDVGG